MDGVMHVKQFMPMDKIEPNMAAVITPKYGKKIVTLMGTDPKYPKYIRAIDKAGNIFYIRKSNLYNLLTGRMP